MHFETMTNIRSWSVVRPQSQSSKRQKILLVMQEQIKNLKKVHDDLKKKIRDITLYFWSEMGKMISFLDQLSLSPVSFQKNKELRYSLDVQNIKKREGETFTIDIADSVSKTSSIKLQIMEEFRELKLLEDKSNYLRTTNQNLRNLRTSLSKDSLTKSMPKLPPRQSYNKHSSNKTKQKIMKTIANTQKQQTNIISFSQNKLTETKKYKKESKPSTDFLTPSRANQQNNRLLLNTTKEFKILKCSNGHKYYEGQTINNIPQGYGYLTSCCPKNPIKTPSKFMSYQGCFNNGLFQGRGVMNLKGEVKFEGTFREGKRHGKGKIFLNEVGQEGCWENDKLQF